MTYCNPKLVSMCHVACITCRVSGLMSLRQVNVSCVTSVSCQTVMFNLSLTLIMLSLMLTLAVLVASATMLPRSPTWRFSEVGEPCCIAETTIMTSGQRYKMAEQRRIARKLLKISPPCIGTTFISTRLDINSDCHYTKKQFKRHFLVYFGIKEKLIKVELAVVGNIAA